MGTLGGGISRICNSRYHIYIPCAESLTARGHIWRSSSLGSIMAEIKLENVNKVFEGGVSAVKDLDLHIKDGEFLVLLGPSGCGKTTTLRMIAGLETQTSGDIRIGDRLVNDLRPGDRDIAFVFQFYALYPHLSVRDNIGFPLKAQNLPQTEV